MDDSLVEASGLRIKCHNHRILWEQRMAICLRIRTHQWQRYDLTLAQDVPILLLLVDVDHIVFVLAMQELHYLRQDPVLLLVDSLGQSGYVVANLWVRKRN